MRLLLHRVLPSGVLALLLWSPSLVLAQSPGGAVIDSVEAAPQVVVPFTRWSRADSTLLGIDLVPGRTVRELGVLLPGLSADLGTGRLHTRSRHGPIALHRDRFPFLDRVGEEPVYEVDGIRMIGEPYVPYDALASVEALTDFVPATIGDAGAGVLRISTQDGEASVRGRLEGVSSAATDPYGYTRLSGALSGPLGDVSVGRFSLAGSWLDRADANPYGTPTLRLSEDAYADVQAHPQVLAVRGEDGGVDYVPFPADAVLEALGQGVLLTEADLLGLLPSGTELVSNLPISTPLVLGPEAYETVRAKAAPRADLTLHGRVLLEPSEGLRVSLGGDLQRVAADGVASPTEQFARLLFNRDGLYRVRQDGWRLSGSLRQQLDGAAFRVFAQVQQANAVHHPLLFTADVRDAFGYGDIDTGPSGAVARRYFVLRNGLYQPLYDMDGGAFPTNAYATFSLPGRPGTVFQQSQDGAFGFGVDGTVRLGDHHLQVGGEFEQRTHRYYRLDGAGLALYADDGFPEIGEGVTGYDDLPISALIPRTSYYGYDLYGLGTTDEEDIDAYVALTNRDLAPYRPIYYAGFVRDRVQWQAVTLDLGIRGEAFDPNTSRLFDPFSTVPIIRVRDRLSAPDGIGLDHAVYFNDQGDVVGYRDLEGTFYDAAGTESTASAIRGAASGQVQRNTEASASEAFTRTSLEVLWQPRIGVSLSLSPTLEGFAYYTRQARRPPASLYTPAATLTEPLGSDRYGAAALRPEVVESGGIGLEAMPSVGVRVAGAAFVRLYRDQVVPVDVNDGFPSYRSYANQGSTTLYGLDGALAYERGMLAVRAHYTLAFATADHFVDAIGTLPAGRLRAPADFDTRHTLDVVAGLRVPDGEGPRLAGAPILGGLGASIAVQARSGFPYTTRSAGGNGAEQSPNETRLPSTAQVDLGLEKALGLASGRLTVVLWIENLLDSRNVLAVYRATGLPGTDGFLATPAGQAFLDGATDSESARFLYESFTGGPVNVGGRPSSSGSLFYGQPRQVRLGLRLSY